MASKFSLAHTPEQIRRYNRRSVEQRIGNRLKVLQHYGKDGKIQCSWPDCEISDPDMLTIDHVHDDGALHRKEIGGGAQFHCWAIRNQFPEGYQTLCWNHQWKKETMRRRERQAHGEDE